MNIQDYHQHMDKLIYEKKKLMTLIEKKKELKSKYRECYKKHCAELSKQARDVEGQETAQRKKLMEMIPDKF